MFTFCLNFVVSLTLIKLSLSYIFLETGENKNKTCLKHLSLTKSLFLPTGVSCIAQCLSLFSVLK